VMTLDRLKIGLCCALGAAMILVANTARAGSYLDRTAMLLEQAVREADYLRARISDRELARLSHRLAEARLNAAGAMSVPKEAAQAHPHLLLVLENYERAADAAKDGQAQRFLVFQQRARDEERTLRGVLKQLGFPLPD
jgi:hypothetical protein